MQLTESNKLKYVFFKLKEAHQELKQSDVKKKKLLKLVYDQAVIFHKSKETEILKLNLSKIENFNFKFHLCQKYKKVLEDLNKDEDEKVKAYLKTL